MPVYHRGETAVQQRAGLAAQAEFSRGGIGRTVPEVAAAFLAEQPMIIVGGTDAGGRVWATQLTGAPGFLRVPAPDVLTIAALPHHDDPLAPLLRRAAAPVQVGMIAIEPATRRRMRLNGRARAAGDGLRVDLDQVIANCPKYLQKRAGRLAGEEGAATAPTVRDGTSLTRRQQESLSRADTFYVATGDDRGAMDASHRGGNPGFVQVLSPTLLRWPDYTGNAMFLTLGNLLLNPAAGLLFPHGQDGTLLHLSGTAHTVWEAEEVERVPGAQRLVEFSVDAVREVEGASALRWGEPAYSRFNPPVR
ncbi:pyridoxamine 5'-phosphate oxidase family protein [Streptomyces sp. NPDC055186]